MKFLDSYSPFAGGDFPSFGGLAIPDCNRLGIQGHRWADMTRHAIQTITHGEPGGARGLNDQMFLAVRNGFGVS